MRVLARMGVVILILLAWVSGPASAESPLFSNDHHFVVVTFANDPYRPSAPAGTTGRRYASSGYNVAQGAHGNARRIANTYTLRQVASWPIRELNVHCVVYEIPDSRPVTEVLAALAKDPRVTLAQPLQEFHTLTHERAPASESAPPAEYNDPLYGLQTNLVSLGISAAHERSQGAGVKVALIDTGVDRQHPDLRDRISSVRSFVRGSSPTPAAPGSYRHGTAMAGLIAATANNKVGIVGIAPLAHIEVFEACWQLKPNADEAECNTFTLAQAIAAALEAHIQLINLSIAGPPDPLLSALVESGIKRGAIFVGSATDNADTFPTNVHGVIGAANSETAGSAAAGAAGHEGLFAAPATQILTLRPDGQYDFVSGTSVAAAEITGLIALLLGTDNHLTGDGVMALLKVTADPAHPVAINVNGALTRLAAERGASRLARSGR